MSEVTRRVDRQAHRRRDPAVLANILVGQLTAQRCSTVYAPSTTKLDAFIKDAVLPLLVQRLDARVVVVERWAKKQGPTVQQLVDAICSQLELTQDPLAVEEAQPRPMARLEAVLQRAERRSDRPLLLVMYRLEELLDEQRDQAEVSRFVEALARMAAMPMHGLHLVLGVKEEDLGAFRDLLRGRWRLLANDVRIRPSGKAWLLSLPLALLGYLSAHAGLVAAVATVSLVIGAAGGAAALGLSAAPQERVCPEPTPVAAPTPAPVVEDPTTGATGVETTADTTAGATEGTTEGSTSEAPPVDPAPTLAATPTDLCASSGRDGECARCVRTRCCSELKACKKAKWRACVLSGKIGAGDCTPELIETNCRGLALCGLEYQCRAECFP